MNCLFLFRFSMFHTQCCTMKRAKEEIFFRILSSRKLYILERKEFTYKFHIIFLCRFFFVFCFFEGFVLLPLPSVRCGSSFCLHSTSQKSAGTPGGGSSWRTQGEGFAEGPFDARSLCRCMSALSPRLWWLPLLRMPPLSMARTSTNAALSLATTMTCWCMPFALAIWQPGSCWDSFSLKLSNVRTRMFKAAFVSPCSYGERYAVHFCTLSAVFLVLKNQRQTAKQKLCL